jgi:hypothetical protein
MNFSLVFTFQLLLNLLLTDSYSQGTLQFQLQRESIGKTQGASAVASGNVTGG